MLDVHCLYLFLWCSSYEAVGYVGRHYFEYKCYCCLNISILIDFRNIILLNLLRLQYSQRIAAHEKKKQLIHYKYVGRPCNL